MRIAIVNDTGMIVESLRRVINAVPDYKIAWIAQDGSQAINKCVADTPDLILMDIVMPNLDGVEATKIIMNQSPCAILLVTDSLKRNSPKIFEAMGYGALDVVHPPILGTLEQQENTQTLLNKIAMIGSLIGVKKRKNTASIPEEKHIEKNRKLTSHSHISSSSHPFLVVIGASTGGPNALASILSHLPSNFPAALIIIQHLESQFAPGLVKWLDAQTSLNVGLATEGTRPEIGKVLLGGTNDHLILRPNLTLTYTKEPQNYPYRPSVDVFFKSVALNWSRKGIAIILTGMGKDGSQGLLELRSKGWHTIAQDQNTSVIYGMPKAAVELKAAVEVLPLEAIAPTLITRLKG